MKATSERLLLLSLLLSLGTNLFAQAPDGYYDEAEGKNQKALLQALCDIVGPHTSVSYKGLWEVYETSDVYPGTNTIWDMYSTAEFRVGADQCGNVQSTIGGCYNREHSVPKSWFDDAYPMYSDAFHVYPTDGKVNGQRSNDPFGECANGKRLPPNGDVEALGKSGTCTAPGYSGNVFEPDDQYKGDFARTYFYMAAAYFDNMKSSPWTSGQGNAVFLSSGDYPIFKDWYINLMLKWHELDPVSQKEIDRNNAVEKYQNNRNPFIDHPELAEYIWGDKKNQGWIPGGITDPVITSPADGKTFDMGITTIGKTLSYSITVKGEGLNEDLSVSVSGTGFSVSPTTVSASAANGNGTVITITYTSSTPVATTGKLTVSSSETSSEISLKAQAVDGIPALPATNITTDSFTARWTDIDKDGSQYSLSVFMEDGTTLLPGYPISVNAAAQQYTVTDLEYAQTYKYQLRNASNLTSNTITVRTAEPIREITADLPTEGLVFSAEPETESDPLSVTVYSEYIDENEITVAVSGQFQISTDKTNWAQTITIATDDTETAGVRIFVRMPALPEGEYSGILSAYTPTVEGFEADVTGTVATPVVFFEDFEQGDADNNYTGGSYQGTACAWKLESAGICNRSTDKFNGKQAVCTGKSGERSIEMAENKANGAGEFSFWAAPYGSDEKADVTISYSTDNGNSWHNCGNVTVSESQMLQKYTVSVKIAQPIRFRIQQTGGKRLNIDDIAISDYRQSSTCETIMSGKKWDAYASNGKLQIEMDDTAEISIYTIDAKSVYNRQLSGNTSISLPAGIYIVVNGNDSRTVIIK